MCLAAGKGVTVVALGGSVSAGHGLEDPANGWISRVFAWLETTFPTARHRLLNHAIPAVTSGYVSACVPDLLPPDVDLVLLEFTYNDWVFDGGSLDVNTPARCGSVEQLPCRVKTICLPCCLVEKHEFSA